MTTLLSTCCKVPVYTRLALLSEEDVYQYQCTACGRLCDILPPEAAVSAGTPLIPAGAHTEDFEGGRAPQGPSLTTCEKCGGLRAAVMEQFAGKPCECVPPASDTPRTDAVTHPAGEYTSQSGVVMACYMQAMERELLTGIEMILARDRRITHLEDEA